MSNSNTDNQTPDRGADFRRRQRQTHGQSLERYGDRIAALLMEMEREHLVVDVDRECFNKDEGMHYADAASCLRRAARACYSAAHDLADVNVVVKLINVSEHEEEAGPVGENPFE